MDDAILDKLRAEHGDVWLLDLGNDQVAFRCPNRAEYKRFLARVSDDRKALPDAQEELARAVVVLPDRAAFSALLDKRPGIASKVVADALKVAGAEEAENAKKL